MKTKLEKAIDNNHGIYEAVFDSLGIAWTKTESIWYCLQETPPLHSNLVTRIASLKPDEIFQKINDTFQKESWDRWSIKDSFNDLDIHEYGFEVLFGAQWMYLDAKKFTPIPDDLDLTYTVAKSTDELAKWRSAWEKVNGELSAQIYIDSVVENKKLFFVMGENKEGEVISLCLLNKTDDVIGISNFCSPEADVVLFWSSMIEFIQTTFGPIDIVGYERKVLLERLGALGIETVGNLRIWVKGHTLRKNN